MKQKLKSNEGFSIIEILAVMAIIVTISGIAIVNWRSGEKQYALQRAASKLSQDIRRAEELAMSTKQFQGQVPEGGYGVFFKVSEKDHYILFADLNNNNHYDPGLDGLVEDIPLEKEIQISQLSPSSPLHITFTPPEPTVTITQDASEAQITLSIKTDPTKIKIIKLNKAGLVYIFSPYTLSVSKSGTGSGTVTSSPDGINCGTDCSEAYTSINSVTLTAFVDFGSTFSGWLGDCTGTGNCVLTMDANKGVTATFNSCFANGTLCNSESQCCSGYCYVDADGDRYSPSSGTKKCQVISQITGTDNNDSSPCTDNYAEYAGTCTTTCKGCITGACVNIPAGSQDTYGSNTCTTTHYRCDGSGACTAPTVCTGRLAYQSCDQSCTNSGYSTCITGYNGNNCTSTTRACSSAYSWTCRCYRY